MRVATPEQLMDLALGIVGVVFMLVAAFCWDWRAGLFLMGYGIFQFARL
jgi:prolipoprotein diacylglyceryltransferase